MAIFIKKNNQLQPVGSMGTVVRDNSLAKSIVDKSVTTITAEDLAGLTSIGIYAFYYCGSLTSVILPDSVTSISSGVFSYCSSLVSITIPSSVTSIGSSAFSSCISLTSITIPDSVTSIGSSAFYNCASLAEIHFRRSIPATVDNINAWGIIPNTCKIYVPTGSLPAYKSASNYPDPNTYQYIEE
jgi:hypothetical protein